MALEGYVNQAIIVKIRMSEALVEGADHTVRFTGPQANPGDAGISPTLMTFTHENWNTEQDLSVTPRRPGTIPVNYKITAAYTQREKNSSFNVFAEDLPEDVPVWQSGDFGAINVYTSPSERLAPGGFGLIVNNRSTLNSIALFSSAGSGMSGPITWRMYSPSGIESGDSPNVSLTELGVYRWEGYCNLEVSAPAVPTEGPTSGPHHMLLQAKVSRPGYDSGFIDTTSPAKLYYKYRPGNYTDGGIPGAGRDAGSGTTSDSWTLPFYASSEGSGWGVEVTGITKQHYPMSNAIAEGKIEVTPSLDAEGDSTQQVTISSPGNVPHVFGPITHFNILYQGNVLFADNFQHYPWTIYLDT
jgi:hypothetical protein